MEKSANDTITTGGALDIDEDDLCRNETDRALHHPRHVDALDPDDIPNPEAVKAALRYGRDTFVVKSDIDPEEDNRAPGIREQD